MKKLALTAALLALTAGAAMAQQVVRIGTEGAYPPYNFINDAGKLDGFEIELGNELCKRAELTCDWVSNDWDSIIPNLISGNYDVIMAGMSITPERAQVIAFTQNYTPPSLSSYAALSEDADIDTGVVAAQVSTIQASHVAETDATLVEFATFDEGVAAVRKGEADAVLADKDYLAPIVAEGDGLIILKDVVLGDGIGAGVRQSDTELKEKLSAAIGTMKEDGSLNALILKWLGDDALTY